MWFTDLWNHSIISYILNAVREGIQVNSGNLLLLYQHQRTVVEVVAALCGSRGCK